jgi:quercetin dioxygenase-like cupin family protein
MFRKLSISLLVISAMAWGQTSATKTTKAKTAATASAQPVVMNLDTMKWGPAPPELPPGSQLTVLEGDPSKAAAYTVRLKMPDGYKIQPHWHPTVEHVTVLSGTLKVGMGAKWDDSNPTVLSSGGFAVMPARMKHFAWTSGETVLQLHGIGPFKIIYVNPNDAPMKPAPTAK